MASFCSMDRNSRKGLSAASFCVLFLFCATLGVYIQVLHHEFINYDDPVYILNNPYVQNGLTFFGIKWAFTTAHAANWHPLTWISHMVDVELYGLHSGLHHLTNLIFHLINTILVFFLFKRITNGVWEAWLIAVLFGLHPLHVESVAWVSERKDVLSTFFFLLGIRAYLSYTNTKGILSCFLVILCFVFGMMAKQMVVTLPCVLLFFDFWPLGKMQENGKISLKKILISIREKIPFFVVSALGAGIALYTQKAGGAVSSLGKLSVLDRISNAVISYWLYLVKTVAPVNLSFLYPHPGHIPLWQPLLAVIPLILITWGAIRFMRTRPWILTGWLFYLVTLLPVIGIIQIGKQSMADRYTYIPLLGIFMIIAIETGRFIRAQQEKWKYPFVILLYILFTALQILTWNQVQHWKNTPSLYRHALRVKPDNYLVLINQGTYYMEKGVYQKAEKIFQEVMRINPDYARVHNNLGLLYEKQNEYNRAKFHYQKALELDPNSSQSNLSRINLGIMYENQGDLEAAQKQYQSVLDKYPLHSRANYCKGILLFKKENYKEAILYLQKALIKDPDNPKIRNSLAVSLAKTGKTEEAVKHLEKAMKFHPDNEEIRHNLKTLRGNSK